MGDESEAFSDYNIMVSFLFLIFIFGLLFGSFLNSLIYRLEEGLPFPWWRSFCPKCRHTLNWLDLIPIFSFLFLKGRCRYCEQKISWQYPLVELATGVLFVFTIYKFYPIQLGDFFTVGYWLLATSFLIVIFVYDLKHYIIPDKIVYPAIVLSFIYQLFVIWNFGDWDLFGTWSLGFGILPSLFFLGIILLSREKWMGMGDFKLAILMGLILGWPNILVALFLAFFIGAIIGIGLVLFRKKTLKSEVPFAPFLISGTFIAIFFGEAIINWYFSLLCWSC